MFIAVNNIEKKEEIGFKQRVLETMKKQIRKKFEPSGRTTMKPNCDAPVYVHNNIQQNTNEKVFN